MTINDLLLNKHYRGNQTELSKDLGVTRNTVRKYMNDDKGEFHFIKNGFTKNPELFTNQTNKANK